MKSSLTISLTADGGLQVELPGRDGMRLIPLRDTTTINATETIRQILVALQRGENEIGLDGAPTRQQVNHWERHQTYPDSKCPFCLKAGAFKDALASHKSSHKYDARYIERDLGNGCSVRRIKQGDTGRKALARERSNEPLNRVTKKSAKELGF
jgi:hypothetical protein